MPLTASGVPSRAAIQAAINESPIIKHVGAIWGTAFNSALHRPKIYSTSIVSSPNANGDIDLLVMSTEFVGVSSWAPSFGDMTTGREIRPWVYNSATLVARVLDAAGAVATGNQRINVTVYGWVAI